MPRYTADFYSVQQTQFNALQDGTSTSLIAPGQWNKSRYLATYDMSTGTVAKSKVLGLVTLPKGAIVLSCDILISATLGSSVVALGTITGSTTTAGAFRAAATLTTPTQQWIPLMVGATLLAAAANPPAPLTDDTLVILTNDATADMPSSGVIALKVEVATVY